MSPSRPESGRPEGGAQGSRERFGRFESVLEAVEEAASGIISEAEVEAERRIAAAEARAERIGQERAAEIARLADRLLDQAGSVRERADSLLSALDSAITELEGTKAPARVSPVAPAPEPVPEPLEAKAPPAPEPEPEPQPEPEAAPPAREDRAEAPKQGGQDPIRSIRERLGSIGRPPQQVPLPASAPRDEAAPAPAPRPAKERPSGAPSQGAVLLATQMAVAGADREQIEARLRNDFGIEDPESILNSLQ